MTGWASARCSVRSMPSWAAAGRPAPPGWWLERGRVPADRRWRFESGAEMAGEGPGAAARRAGAGGDGPGPRLACPEVAGHRPGAGGRGVGGAEFIDGRTPPRLDDFVAEQMIRILGLQEAMFPGGSGGWGQWAAGVVFEDWHGLRDRVASGVPGG